MPVREAMQLEVTASHPGDAADYVPREEPAWQAWLQGLSVPA